MIFLADVLSLGGQTEAALQMTAKAKELIDQTGRRMLSAYLHWLEGEIITRELHRGGSWTPDSSPETCYERAVEVARSQQALSLQLRAVTSLARLLKQTGRLQEAKARLQEICACFEGEGETPDLREARLLLTELRD
jgi:predicted ATPase